MPALPEARTKLNPLAAHIVHRGNQPPLERRYAHRMSAETKKSGGVADEFDARAATFRRVAADMKDPDDRAELLRIAQAYEEDAARLRDAAPIRS